MNDITNKVTDPIGYILPTRSIVGHREDYSGLGIDIDSTNRLVVLDLGRDCEEDDEGTKGVATVAFDALQLKMLLSMLSVALEYIEKLPEVSDATS